MRRVEELSASRAAAWAAAVRGGDVVDPIQEGRALAAFREARDAGLHDRLRTRRRDDWRPGAPWRRRSARAAALGLAAALLAGGAAVAAAGSGGTPSPSTALGRPSEPRTDSHAPGPESAIRSLGLVADPAPTVSPAPTPSASASVQETATTKAQKKKAQKEVRKDATAQRAGRPYDRHPAQPRAQAKEKPASKGRRP